MTVLLSSFTGYSLIPAILHSKCTLFWVPSRSTSRWSDPAQVCERQDLPDPSHCVGKRERVHVVYLESSRALDAASHSLLDKLAAHGSDGCAVCWVKTAWVAVPKVPVWMELNVIGGQSWVAFPRAPLCFCLMLDEGIKCILRRLANNTKWVRSIICVIEEALQGAWLDWSMIRLHLCHKNPMQQYGPGEDWLESTRQKRTWMSWQPAEHGPAESGWPKKPMVYWPASEIMWPVGPRKGCPLFTQQCCDNTSHMCPVWGSLLQKGH